MRKTVFLGIAALAGCLSTTPVLADKIDIAEATCKDVLELKQDDLTAILMWTHGYFGGKVGDTTIDFAGFEAAGKVIGEYCGQHPDEKWLESIEKLGS